MEILSIKQPNLSSILNDDIDLVICASGFESRSSHLARRLKKCKKAHFVCFSFMENKDKGARTSNDKLYKELGYESIMIPGHSSNDVESIIKDILQKCKSKTYRIIIDISSMTRAWYGGVVRALKNDVKMDRIIIHFIYIPSAYHQTTAPYPPNEVVTPVKGFSGICLPEKPVALIIGLGQETGRAVGIKEELDPDLLVTFRESPSTDKRFVEAVQKSNSELLEKILPENQFHYPLKDSILTFQLLDNVCMGIQRNFRIVLVSLGPKLFGLCCFLIATKYPEISVWRISAGSKGEVVDVKPSREIVVMEVEWIAGSNTFDEYNEFFKNF